MPIILPAGLPAADSLRAEGFEVLEAPDRLADERTLKIALLNIMPKKPETETQIARLLAGTSLPVALSLLLPDGYRPRTADPAHLARHYRRWSEARRERFDGLIITGAPVETLAFEAVDYWPALTRILDWAARETLGSLHICWAAQAALYHFHGVPKRALPEKCFGVFPQRVLAPDAPVLQGFGERFPVPVSRYTEVAADDLPRHRGLELLADSPESGLCLVEDKPRRALYMFNHWEYDAATLAEEYERDRAADLGTALPRNAFPDNDPRRAPTNGWRPQARLFFANWLRLLAARRGESREFLARRARPAESDRSSCPSSPSATRTGRPRPSSPCWARPVSTWFSTSAPARARDTTRSSTAGP